MRRLSQRHVYLLTLFCISLIVSLFSAGPAFAQLPTPNQPILVVQNSASSDPYQNFVPQLLTTEGLNGFQTAQLPSLTASFLSNYDVVILPHLTLTSAQATLFQNYVSAGGTLIGFRPDQQLASVFGVNVQGTTVAEGWLAINAATPYGVGLVSQVLRFHGTADAYSLLTASSLATLYSTATAATPYPAVAMNTYGSGKAVLFAFDLTQSIVLLRQGNPAWAGYPNTHDGYNTMRASQMFMDKTSGQFWNDLGDGSLNDVPQADEEMRLFSNAVVLTNEAKRPLPRLWYFPNQARAMVLITGDHHGDASSDSSSEITTLQSYGGHFQEYLWHPYGAITSSSVQTWQNAGHRFGVHFDDTAEEDSSGVGGSHVTWTGMTNVMNADLGSLTSAFPTVSNPPISNRNHYLIWVSNNSAGTPDQTAGAKLLQNFGIQMDTSFSSFPNRWGYMNGSGLPMQFLDTTNGTVVPVYEQATQYEDDVQLSSNTYSVQWAPSTAASHYQKSISDSLNKYNTVVTFLFHPDHWNVSNTDGGPYQSDAQTVFQYAQSNGVPMWAADDWNTFWVARSAATLSKPSFNSSTLSFTVSGTTAGLSLLIPDQSGSNVVSGVKVDGGSQTFTVMNLQGVLYAGVVVGSGSHSVSTTYAPAGSISGTISPSSAAASTTIQIQSGTATQSVSPASDGTYTVGPLPAGVYTVTPTSSAYSFSPSSQNVTLGSANVSGINFTGTATAPSGETIFTSQSPLVSNGSDGAGTNYELGTAFTSDVGGKITAIRFWKANSETAAHTGRIWSSSGQLLASVTFTNETASGWQQQNLTTSLSIAANTQYIVSVNTANSYYVSSNSGLASAVVNQDLSTVVGNNGIYASTPGQFPSTSWQHSNYFRDIVFIPVTNTASGSITPAAVGANTTLTLSGPVGATISANSAGNYSFTGLIAGSYSVTPSLTGYSFSPASQNFTINGTNVTGLNFTATAKTYSLTGTISPAASGNGATVTLGGTASGTATANSSGVYTFTGLVPGSYTVTPSKTGFGFIPASASATISNANVTGVNFTAATAYTITGTVSGAGGNGATLTLSGAGNATVTANASGAYTFTGILAGSYTVTPSKTGYTFNPVNRSVTITNANLTGVNFASLYSISGTVSGGGGATVNLTGAASAAVTADASGVYTFTGLSNGSYTVTPTLAGMTFTPANASATINNANVSGLNFSAVLQTYSLTGTISGTGGNGATVALTGAATATVTANASGAYTFSGLSNGSYTVTPSATGYAFTPANASVTISNASMSGVNFTSAAVTSQTLLTTQTPVTTGSSDGANVNYELGMLIQSATPGQITAIRFWKDSHESGTHTGHIWSASGTVLASVTFTGETASGWQQQALAIPLSIVANTTYVVSVNTGNTYYVDTVSGLASQIVNQNLSSVLGSNGVYATTPGQFPSSSWSSSNYFRDVVFSAGTSSTPFVVSGTVSPAAAAAATTLTLSGGANGATVPNASGVFSFSGLVNGTYTITPAASGYAFSPASSTITVSGGNVTGVNFTGTSSQSIFTTQVPATTGASDGANANYELGTVFTSTVAGQITGVRFWKDSHETGTHTGHVWSATGSLLATVTFTNETASGWQVQSLTTPLSIAANTQYTVSVNTGNSYYVTTNSGLASQIVNGDLKTVVGNDGVFGTAGQFPSSSWQNSNYFRDVVFVP